MNIQYREHHIYVTTLVSGFTFLSTADFLFFRLVLVLNSVILKEFPVLFVVQIDVECRLKCKIVNKSGVQISETVATRSEHIKNINPYKQLQTDLSIATYTVPMSLP